MNRGTHLVFGVGVSLILVNPLFIPTTLAVLVGGVIGSTLPDLDLRIKHRMLLHNIFSLIILAIIAYVLSSLSSITAPYTSYLVLAFAIAYMSHLFLDMFTKAGVSLLYPLNRRRYRLLKLKSTSSLANALLTILGLLMVVYWVYSNGLLRFKPLGLQQP